MNRQTRALCVLACALSATLTLAAVPSDGFNGVWVAVKPPVALRSDSGALPPLTVEAQTLYAAHVAARKAGKADFDGTLLCQPPGLPRVYLMGMPFEIQVEEKFIHFLYQWGRNNRVVELNTTHENQKLFAPYYFGWGTGAWQGGALTIDSVLFNDTTLLDNVGLPHSIDMHLAERWTLGSDGNSLAAAFTIDDAANYTAPWTTTLHFKRAPKGTEIQEDICLERLNLVNRWERTTGWAQLPEGRVLAAMSNIGVDSRGHVWVADRCGPQMCTDSPLAPILEFDANGKYLQSFGAGLFVAPHGMHIDRAGDVWVTDFRAAGGKGGQVHKFRRDGKLLLSLGQKGASGTAPEQFNVPSDIASTRDGTIYVADGHGAGTNERIV
jgi:hypothetical protein